MTWLVRFYAELSRWKVSTSSISFNIIFLVQLWWKALTMILSEPHDRPFKPIHNVVLRLGGMHMQMSFATIFSWKHLGFLYNKRHADGKMCIKSCAWTYDLRLLHILLIFYSQLYLTGLFLIFSLIDVEVMVSPFFAFSKNYHSRVCKRQYAFTWGVGGGDRSSDLYIWHIISFWKKEIRIDT